MLWNRTGRGLIARSMVPAAPWRQWIAAVVALVALGAVIAGARPARLRSARVTHVSGGNPPCASIALAYGPGARPPCVVIDVSGAHGTTGSATVGGDQEFIEAPLAGKAGGPYRVDVTAVYRVAGVPVVRHATFGR